MTKGDKLFQKVQLALDQVRPFLEQDGGDMELIGITEEMVVQIKLLGSCRSCDMSPMTMRAGVEEIVKREVPEIKGVEAINVPRKKSVAAAN